MSPNEKDLDALRIDRSGDRPARSYLWILLVFFLIAAAVATGWWLTRSHAAAVRTAVVGESALPGGQRTVLNASGYVTARRQATVSSKITGRVVEVFIEEGLKVDKGQVLARLDRSNVLARLNLAGAELNAARSTLAETEVRLKEAGINLGRVRSLVAQKVSSEAELDAALAEADALEARLAMQREEVAVAREQVALQRRDLEDTVIRAPFAGVVVSKNAQPGEMISPVSAGSGFTRTGICTVVDMDSLEIEVDVNEGYINRVVPGQPVKAVLDAYPDWKIPSAVIAIIPTADRQKATVRVRIGFEEPDPRILPDMGVKVSFQETEAPGEPAERPRPTIPKSALRKDGGRDIVFVLKDGRVERRAVLVSEMQEDQVVLASGVTPGEKVVVEGPADLADGAGAEEVNR